MNQKKSSISNLFRANLVALALLPLLLISAFHSDAAASNKKKSDCENLLEDPEQRNFDTYIRVASAHKVLPKDVQNALVERYQANRDAEALNLLINHNQGLILLVAKKYRSSAEKVGLSLLDLVQEGNLGFFRGIEKFDSKRGINLSTYSINWISAYISKAVKNARKKGFNGSFKQGTALGQVKVEPFSRYDLEDGTKFEESVMSDLDIEADVQRDDFNAKLAVVVENYIARKKRPVEVAIIRERLMNSDDPATLTELGQKFNLSRERIRQLEVIIKKELRLLLSKYREE